MSDLVDNPEDLFSQNEAHMSTEISLVARESVLRVLDHVRHKAGCTATEDG